MGSRDDKLGSADTVAALDSTTPDAGGGEDHVEPGQQLSHRYQVRELLGGGGMGRVYLAFDHELDELVALKLLPASFARDTEAVRRMRQEVKLARRVTHTNVARVFDLGEHDGRYFLTMEYIDGESVAERLRRSGWLDEKTAVRILVSAARGLHAAHQAGVVHRDVKPDNILVSRSGRVVVTDFGIAQPTDRPRPDARFTAGTPAYMSPEQVRGEPVSELSDVFSLGVTAFRMVTGELPWSAESALATARARLTAAAPPCNEVRRDVSPALSRVISRALSERRQSRYGSMTALVDALLEAVPVQSRTDSTTRFAPLVAPADQHDPKRVVAVLPLQSRGEDTDAYLAPAFTEELIDGLSQLGGLRVLSFGAVRDLDTEQPAHELGTSLGCEVVINGWLSRTNGKVQIKLRAISCADAHQLWSRRFVAESEDLLDVSAEITEALAAELGAAEREPVRDQLPNHTAMDFYLRARAASQQLSRSEEALSLFERALEHAPSSGLVNAGFAIALTRHWMIVERDESGIVERATRAARIALRVSPHLGEPHLALGFMHLHTGDPVAAVREFRMAVARAPSLADAHWILGTMLVELDRLGEAEQRLAIARRVNPTQPMLAPESTRVAALRGDWARVDELFATPEMKPTTPIGWLQRVRFIAYRRDLEALRQIGSRLDEVKELFGLLAIVRTLIAGYTGAMPVAEALERLTPSAENSSKRRNSFAWQLLAELAGHGEDVDRALDAIEKAVDVGLVDLFWLRRCPLLDPVRSHPRFAAIRDAVTDRAHAAYDAYRS